jgi:hypothetical protein
MNQQSIMPEGFLVVFGQENARAEVASRDALVKPSRYAPGCADSTSLTRWQEREGRQWRAAEVVHSMYGWSLRHASGLDGFGLIAGARSGQLNGTLKDCLLYAARWQREAPESRYVFIRTYGLTDEDREVLQSEMRAATVPGISGIAALNRQPGDDPQQPQTILARLAASMSDGQLEQTYCLMTDPEIIAVLDAELDARNDEATAGGGR